MNRETDSKALGLSNTAAVVISLSCVLLKSSILVVALTVAPSWGYVNKV